MQNSRIINNRIYNNVIYHFSNKWPSVNFDDALVKAIPNYKKYKRKEIAQSGKIPVIDQGTEEIAGFINDETGKYSGELPIVIFGDHTRIFKYIDYDFAVGADGTKLLKPKEQLIEKFMYYYLKSIHIPPSGYSRHYKYLKEIKIPIPDKTIQQNIIEYLDNLLPRVQLQSQHLAAAKSLIRNFRKTILTSAITGMLTNINYEKQDFTEVMEIPSHWEKVQLKQIVLSLKTGPFGSTLHHEDYVSGGIPVINPLNINNQSIVPSNEVTITPETKLRLSSYILNKNDIIIARRGEMGRCAVVTDKEDGWLCGTGCFIITPSNLISSEYLSLIISSIYGVNYLSENSVGTTMQNLNLGILGNLLIPLPELSEQHEIVNKIRRYFNLSNQIEWQIEKAEVRVSNLTQAILAKTFSNESSNSNV